MKDTNWIREAERVSLIWLLLSVTLLVMSAILGGYCAAKQMWVVACFWFGMLGLYVGITALRFSEWKTDRDLRKVLEDELA